MIRQLSTDMLTQDDRDAVAHFFMHVKIAYPMQYDRAMPNQATEKEFKRRYAPYIKKFQRPEIDAGFNKLHNLKQLGDLSFDFMDIDKLIYLVNDVAKLARQRHHELMPKTTQKSVNRELALKSINRLKSMFKGADR